MSTFKVKLTGYGTGPTAQGALASAGGVDQRSVWIMGPDRVNRELKAGAACGGGGGGVFSWNMCVF